MVGKRQSDVPVAVAPDDDPSFCGKPVQPESRLCDTGCLRRATVGMVVDGTLLIFSDKCRPPEGCVPLDAFDDDFVRVQRG